MVIRGLNPRPKPWKIIPHHKVDNLKHNFKRQWHLLVRWLMPAKIIINQGFPLWQGIWVTWCKIHMVIFG
jgi:hypothetical protein